jgi:hypothetical protein
VLPMGTLEGVVTEKLEALGGHARSACEWAVARGVESGRAR